jgi:hypothetical protein
MLFLMANGPMQTTAAFAKVGTGTSIKTMMQVKPILPCRIVEWGFSFDGYTAATPLQVELIETGIVNATVTAYAAADISSIDSDALAFVANSGSVTSSFISVGTAASGYTSSAEGSITSVRNLAGPQLAPPTGPFIEQFPLGREPVLQVGNFTRIRVTAPSGVNMYCYLVLAF